MVPGVQWVGWKLFQIVVPVRLYIVIHGLIFILHFNFTSILSFASQISFWDVLLIEICILSHFDLFIDSNYKISTSFSLFLSCSICQYYCLAAHELDYNQVQQNSM